IAHELAERLRLPERPGGLDDDVGVASISADRVRDAGERRRAERARRSLRAQPPEDDGPGGRIITRGIDAERDAPPLRLRGRVLHLPEPARLPDDGARVARDAVEELLEPITRELRRRH